MPAMPGAELFFEGAVNFRELGGYPTADGRTVRRGLLYRGGNLDALQSPADQAKLQSLGLRTVLDLRSAGEAGVHPDPALPGVENLRVCAMCHEDGTEMDFSSGGIRRLQEEKDRFEMSVGRRVHDHEWFSHLYAQMPFGNKAYHTLFRLLEERRVPILFHCSCGKDRTGIGAMLILLALGVDRTLVLRDYMLTNTYRRAILEAHLATVPVQERPLLIPVEGVSYEMANGTLLAIEGRYASYEAYFAEEFGLNAPRLDALRAFYLE
ncbi:MAG: tyrosine-protein phosphatase [Gemmiger sp.]